MIRQLSNNIVFTLIAIFSIVVTETYAQTLQDTLQLKEVEIKSQFLLNNQTFKRVRIDSSLLLPRINSVLSDILAQNSSIFIKSYGNSGIATATFRGTSAAHTQVEWNGISINSPMLGQMDLSQIPVSQFNNIEILYGAAGIPNTSGAFGGVINLVSNPDWENKVNILVVPTIASFGTYSLDGSFEAGSRKFQSATRVNFSNSVNYYPYYDNKDQLLEQVNAAYRIWGLSEDLFFRIGEKDLMIARIWYSDDYRNVPPTVTNLDSYYHDKLSVKSVRSLLEWKRAGKNYSLSVRSAFMDQSMNWRNDTMNNNHRYDSWLNRLKFSYTGIRKLSVKPGFDINYDRVNSEAYDGIKTRLTLSLFSEFNYEMSKKINLSFVFRQDFIDDSFMPFIPAVGASYKPFNRIDLTFSGNLSKNYRYPTLNDLYWVPGGNPDLKTENDYAAELSTVYHFLTKQKNFRIEAELTGYYSFMQDLILWFPVTGSVWKPENVSEVLSRGLEAGLNISWLYNKLSVVLTNNYNFCKATYEKASFVSDVSVGKQLIYTPVNTFNSMLNVNYYRFYLNYNFMFVGKRFTSKDNLSYMPAYNLSDIIFGKNFVIRNYILSLQLQINNVFDLALRSIANVPMPGRNYAFSLRFNFTK